MNCKTPVLTGLTILLAAVAAPLHGQDPYEQEEDTWISIDGTVDAVSPNMFTLDYGDGVITVEMDDADRDATAYELMQGDRVTVSGMIEDEFFQARTIDANSIYIENLGTYFYSSDREQDDTFVNVGTPVMVGRTFLQGTVTEVDDEEFTLQVGMSSITVEVEEMPYNPLDEDGYQRVQVGDMVTVSGDMDTDLFEGTEFVAETLVVISS